MAFKPSAGPVLGAALTFASAGFAVILRQGQATWVPQNHWLAPGLFSIGGILLLWSGWLGRRSRAKISSALKQTEQTVIHPETSGTGSSSLAAGRDIHINYGAPASVAPVPSKAVQTTRPVVEAAGPNLQYVTSKEKPVFVSPLSRDGVCDPRNQEEHKKALQALILKFENRVLTGRKITSAMNVIAKVRFRSKDGVTERVIDYGVWLNSPCNSTGMDAGDTRELVLMCTMDDGSLITFEDRREGNHQFYDQWSYIEESVVDDLETVEVTLVDKNTQATLVRRLRIWRDGARFCVAEH